jgi:hypothetical protein
MAVEPTPSSTSEAHFSVGSHLVRLSRESGRWRVFLDAGLAPFDQSYATQAEAWEAGVREADRIDRLAAA